MRICTITCHDVYNAGASLQAYALQTYLKSLGHDVKIIDYKPDYLSQHYRLDVVANPKYDKPLLKQAYLLAKLPGRLRMLPRPDLESAVSQRKRSGVLSGLCAARYARCLCSQFLRG